MGNPVYQNLETKELLIMDDTTFFDRALVTGSVPSLSTLPTISGYTLFGLVGIPGVHDPYGDGSCGIVTMDSVSPTALLTNIPTTVKNYPVTYAVQYADGVYSTAQQGYPAVGPFYQQPSNYVQYPLNSYLYQYNSTAPKLISPYTAD